MRSHRYVPALVLLIGIGIATPACAAQTYGYGQRNGGYGREFERRAYDAGYRDGLQEGLDDARRGRDFSYSRHDDYRDADQGYRRGTIDRDSYRRAFRQGFQTGYSESFNRYAGNGNNGRYNYPRVNPRDRGITGYPSNRGVYRSPAGEIGYRDGIEAGRDDARDRDAFDPIRAKRYRDGDHNYDSRYGSRDAYKREYRAAFEQGYREGYGRVR